MAPLPRTLRVAAAALCALWPVLAGTQQFEPLVRLEITDVAPGPGATLALGEPVYVRVLYQTTEDILIFGRARRSGASLEGVRGKSHPSPVYTVGSGGEALVWFTFDEPVKITDLRVEAIAARKRLPPLAAVTVPLPLEWAAGGARPTRPAWAERLQQEANERIRAQSGKQPSTPGLDLFVALLFGSVPAYLALQGYAFWRFRGRLNAAIWLPAVLMGACYAFVIVTAVAGSNLSPIWLVFLSPLALAWIALVVGRDLWRARAG